MNKSELLKNKKEKIAKLFMKKYYFAKTRIYLWRVELINIVLFKQCTARLSDHKELNSNSK